MCIRDSPARPARAAEADLVVNATTLGMPGSPDRLPFDPSLLGAGQVVVDIVYPETPFVTAARRRGAVAADGLGMLVHQAAGAFRLWTGLDAPLGAMSGVVARLRRSTD